ncbi:MAG: hypothetical protein C4346_17290 [Chloroflexota bacterium]
MMLSLRRQPIIASRYPWSRWWWLAAFVAVMTMPSSFRGGADLPHPHAFFQFWGHAAEAFTHHAPYHPEYFPDRQGLPGANGITPASPKPDLPSVTDQTAQGERTSVISFLSGALLLLPILEPQIQAFPIPKLRLPNRFVGPEPPPPRPHAG